MSASGPDERRIRQLLRRRGVGPDALPPPEPTAQPARAPDWFDRLYTDEQSAEPADHRRWYSLHKDRPAGPASEQPAAGEQPEELAPSVHITIHQTRPGTLAPRRSRIRRWILVRGTAAAIGWWLGLGPLLRQFLTDFGPRAIGAAAFFYVVAWIAASRLTDLVPAKASREIHTAIDWAAHIPGATVLLTVALHTPNALV